MKSAVPSEEYECKLFVEWLEDNGYMFTHVPNEAPSKGWRLRNARMGTRAGFPDFVVITHSCRLLLIEMKRTKGGRVSEEQKTWLLALQATGTSAKVCRGHFEAISAVLEEEHEGQQEEVVRERPA